MLQLSGLNIDSGETEGITRTYKLQRILLESHYDIIHADSVRVISSPDQCAAVLHSTTVDVVVKQPLH